MSSSGVYLVICNLITDSVASNASTDFKITVNGAAYFTDKHWKDASMDPQSHAVCLIMNLDGGDYLNFIVNNF